MRLQVIEQIGLLHVRAMQLDWDLFEKFCKQHGVRVDLLLNKLWRILSEAEGANRFFAQAVSVQWIETVVTFLSVVHKQNRIFEAVGLLEHFSQDFYIEAKSHAGVHVKANFIRVHQLLLLVFHDLREFAHLSAAAPWHRLSHEKRIRNFPSLTLDYTHEGSLRIELRLPTMLYHVKKSRCVNDNSVKCRALIYS